MVLILKTLGFWKTFMIKDTVIWIFFVGIPWFFYIGDLASDADFFKNRINEVFKWTIIVEFIINLYINV